MRYKLPTAYSCIYSRIIISFCGIQRRQSFLKLIKNSPREFSAQLKLPTLTKKTKNVRTKFLTSLDKIYQKFYIIKRKSFKVNKPIWRKI